MDTIDLSAYDNSDKINIIDNSIEYSKNNPLILSQISHKINYNDEFLTYDENILNSYKNYLSQFCIFLKIPEEYYYKPELVAKEMYGTVDLWYLILFFSNCPSAEEFNKSVIKIFDPAKFSVLNKLMNITKKSLNLNNKKPDKIDNLIIKKVIISDTKL